MYVCVYVLICIRRLTAFVTCMSVSDIVLWYVIVEKGLNFVVAAYEYWQYDA